MRSWAAPHSREATTTANRGVAGSQIIGGPLPAGTEGIIYADMDLDLWVRGKLLQDFAGHYNRPDVFTLEVNRAPSGYEDPSSLQVST